jgi:hypothetical protein
VQELFYPLPKSIIPSSFAFFVNTKPDIYVDKQARPFIQQNINDIFTEENVGPIIWRVLDRTRDEIAGHVFIDDQPNL